MKLSMSACRQTHLYAIKTRIWWVFLFHPSHLCFSFAPMPLSSVHLFFSRRGKYRLMCFPKITWRPVPSTVDAWLWHCRPVLPWRISCQMPAEEAFQSHIQYATRKIGWTDIIDIYVGIVLLYWPLTILITDKSLELLFKEKIHSHVLLPAYSV